ncbi:small, acid-soluble spore protein tlp [Garciella nitratireducens DSM 15102]|uniref:Small, acid-soluble spore protein tlp n=2 Tax=Garciella TaxID=218204 RepID=A0A1T4MB99_9FIRM|nr:small, acid-soluble spore protein tlp [Garciella nitratireducens DSM 15102]
MEREIGGMKKTTKPNPDNRKDNVEKIDDTIGKTIQNMELAEEIIEIFYSITRVKFDLLIE